VADAGRRRHRYKDAADVTAFMAQGRTARVIPLILVTGWSRGEDAQGKKLKFFAVSIPVDPMNRQKPSGHLPLHAGRIEQRLPGAGQNVFDVASKSQASALDGTKYSDW